jgi:DNA repair protein RecO
MYAIHTTPGFIIESRPSGEAGKLLAIFTRDLGLVWAVAQGIRLEKSKLRFHSQEYSFGEYSFVRGKEFWRLTSANESKEKDAERNLGREAKELVGRVALLLRRLLQGEESHTELFAEIESAVDFMHTNNLLSQEQFQTLESLIIFRILKLLGYIGSDKQLDLRMVTEPFSVAMLDETAGQRMELNKHINKALRESHL